MEPREDSCRSVVMGEVLDRRRFETYQYDFQTQDGRFVTIASNSCTGWVFRQIDLKMGTVRDVGDFDAIARGGKSGGCSRGMSKYP